MKAWLQLFRFPNLFTVPGDPLAASLIAPGGRFDARVLPAIVASLCFYAAGLAMNDLADYQEDLRDRPKRPLPSGRISVRAAWTAVIALCVVGLGSLVALGGPHAGAVGVGLLVHIALYNFLTKRIPFLGAINMGLCRALSAALGAVVGLGPDIRFSALATYLYWDHPLLALSAAPYAWPSGLANFQIALVCGSLLGLYIAAVTNLARHETNPSYPRLPRLLPIGALLIGFVVLKMFTGRLFFDQAPTLWVVGLVLCTMNAGQLMTVPPPPLAPRIGGFIRLMPILQAALCLVPSVPTPLQKTPACLLSAVLLLACVPLHAKLGKKFYAS